MKPRRTRQGARRRSAVGRTIAGSLVTASGRATSAGSIPDVLDMFVARGDSETPNLRAPAISEEIMERLHEEGLDTNELSRRGLFTLVSARDSYLKNPTFTPEFMVAFMRLQIIRKRADNQPSHFLTGEMERFFTNRPGVESMHDYEAALNWTGE